MRAGPVAGDLGPIADVAPQRVEQRVAGDGAAPAELPQVALVAAAVDELGERLLLEGRRVAIAQPLGRRERGDQRRRHDHVADPQRREDGPREGADVEDAAAAIESLQRLEPAAVVAELAVVVVLDDQGVGALGPLQQRLAA